MAAYATICIGLFAISRPMAKSLAPTRQPG
jgi:hypothetical protein